MAKPDVVPSWATDTNFSAVSGGGGEVGTVVKVAPSAAVAAQGSRDSSGVNALHLNYILNKLGLWMTWLDGFLAEALTWTGAATFTPSVATTNGVTCTGNTSGSGVKGTGGATNGLGVEGIGTAAGSGVKGTGGATDGAGVTGLGTAAGVGVVATGGATGYGARCTGNATKSAINLVAYAGDPSSLVVGDIWFDSNTATFRCCRTAGAATVL